MLPACLGGRVCTGASADIAEEEGVCVVKAELGGRAISKRQGAQRHALADRNCCSVRSADCNLLHPAHTQLEPAPLSAEEQKLQTLSSDGGLRAPLNILRQLRAFPHVPVFSGWVARLKHQHQQPRSFEM
ncbi:hypothetical protein PF005_g17612 [Phytophthora fragariae]|uniref:Uncharacterized protein n=1 Tax=Phytophthora fragariae TaxID=53985 RepID=A0A6A3X3S8_9STRA|nr:hypothetical protein PF005_g17612 [Phytophthora fragariae]